MASRSCGDRLLRQLLRPVQLLAQRRGRRAEPGRLAAGHLHRHAGAEHELADAVVQFAGDPVPFGVQQLALPGGRQPLLGPPQLVGPRGEDPPGRSPRRRARCARWCSSRPDWYCSEVCSATAAWLARIRSTERSPGSGAAGRSWMATRPPTSRPSSVIGTRTSGLARLGRPDQPHPDRDPAPAAATVQQCRAVGERPAGAVDGDEPRPRPDQAPSHSASTTHGRGQVVAGRPGDLLQQRARALDGAHQCPGDRVQGAHRPLHPLVGADEFPVVRTLSGPDAGQQRQVGRLVGRVGGSSPGRRHIAARSSPSMSTASAPRGLVARQASSSVDRASRGMSPSLTPMSRSPAGRRPRRRAAARIPRACPATSSAGAPAPAGPPRGQVPEPLRGGLRVVADDVRQQDPVDDAVRQVEQPAHLVAHRVGGAEDGVGEGQSGLQAGLRHLLAGLHVLRLGIVAGR